MLYRSRHFYNMLLFVVLAAVVCGVCGCKKAETASYDIVSPSVAPTETPAVVSFVHDISSTPAPTLAPTPEPTPEPTPTPTPVPTADPGSDAVKNLLWNYEEIRIIKSSQGTRVYDSASTDGKLRAIRNTEIDSQKSEFIILGETVSSDGTDFYYVSAAFNGECGYIPKKFEKASELGAEGLTGYGILNRPNTPIYKSWYSTATSQKIKAWRTYCAVRVLGSWNDRALVVTEDGVYGYVDKEQIYYITREEMEQYLIDKQENADVTGSYSTEAFLSAAQTQIGTSQESTERWIVDLLTDCGMVFNPGYYYHFRKIFSEELYPNGLYKDEVYQSLLFKLRNTAGDMVTCNGEETEWDYIGTYEEVCPGDILFFATYNKGDTAIVPDVEVVFYGKYSGFVTKCGIALGDNRMLTVENGQVMLIEDITSTDYFAYFDSARRIQPTITDYKAHLIECQIAAIYDRLGTPYSNTNRLGDSSYDCSGIVSWSLTAIGAKRSKGDKEGFTESTASGFRFVKNIYFRDKKLTCGLISEEARQAEDIENLQRGDYVFLLNSSKSHIGHIMIYLGDNTVIHSTTINSKYRGTLVAQFRPELQKLYSCALRINSLEE